MAKLKAFRCVWYARVRWRQDSSYVEKIINLNTKSKVTARKRLSVVNQCEDEIIELYYKGENYSFAWMNKDGKVKLIKLKQ